MKQSNFDIGIAVDPDVDRLVLICENGEPYNEEYTLAAVSDYILSHQKGNIVSNLSSTKALKDVTRSRGGNYYSAAVGELNVVEKMKEVNAVIGGEGNGGIIYLELHYGRDALVGIRFILSSLAESNISLFELKQKFPHYYMFKHKIDLPDDLSIDIILEKIKAKYLNYPLITIDGIKIEMDNSWVYPRKSNTEAVIGVYSEANTHEKAQLIALEVSALVL